MIPNFSLTTFPALCDESGLHLPSGADAPVRRLVRVADTGTDAGYPFGADVALPAFTGLLQASHVQPLGLRLARVRRP